MLFVAGMLVGGLVGVIIMALFQAAGEYDAQMDQFAREQDWD
jgi:hypothetical protein